MNFWFRLHLLPCVTFCAALVCAQNPGVRATANQPREHEQWFGHGRVIPGQSAAALRYRAHRQKLELRALHAAPHSAAMSAFPRIAPATVWTPLGPAPLASDASGLGVQDYGPVAGRATAVAIDPADASGNTVYVGGAYGGVWKSTNAGTISANPSSVTWTALTDDQPTLAVGAIAIQRSRLNNQPDGLSPVSCPATPSTSSCLLYRGEFAVVPGRNEMYFWFVDGNNMDRKIWQTKNAGVSWTELIDDGITNCGDAFGCGTEQATFNLELAAVPNGEVTDLYAGAVNLFKCRITTASPGCHGSGADTFLNLTHAFGCPPSLGSIAHVHPNQHAMSFLQINSNHQVVMYFANDGGIYRALDGYTGLITGTCGGSNQFDSLNDNLGSITQLVSFSQHPTDPNTILAGAQDNGSPATSSSQGNMSWANVNSGGGYNEINPGIPNQWFTSNTGVSIQRCAFGVNCRAQDFSSGLVVSNTTVGGDGAGLFTPFIIDPQNSGELLVGSCRMWRGATDGTGFSLLTDNFETGGTETCTGGEVNLVRAIAAGGPTDPDGSSNVMYAGTDGLGPLAPGGHIWVATNVSGGPSAWVDRTGGTNPSGFPVSGIAIDKSDTTGRTAA